MPVWDSVRSKLRPSATADESKSAAGDAGDAAAPSHPPTSFRARSTSEGSHADAISSLRSRASTKTLSSYIRSKGKRQSLHASAAAHSKRTASRGSSVNDVGSPTLLDTTLPAVSQEGAGLLASPTSLPPTASSVRPSELFAGKARAWGDVADHRPGGKDSTAPLRKQDDFQSFLKSRRNLFPTFRLEEQASLEADGSSAAGDGSGAGGANGLGLDQYGLNQDGAMGTDRSATAAAAGGIMSLKDLEERHTRKAALLDQGGFDTASLGFGSKSPAALAPTLSAESPSPSAGTPAGGKGTGGGLGRWRLLSEGDLLSPGKPSRLETPQKKDPAGSPSKWSPSGKRSSWLNIGKSDKRSVSGEEPRTKPQAKVANGAGAGTGEPAQLRTSISRKPVPQLDDELAEAAPPAEERKEEAKEEEKKEEEAKEEEKKEEAAAPVPATEEEVPEVQEEKEVAPTQSEEAAKENGQVEQGQEHEAEAEAGKEEVEVVAPASTAQDEVPSTADATTEETSAEAPEDVKKTDEQEARQATA